MSQARSRSRHSRGTFQFNCLLAPLFRLVGLRLSPSVEWAETGKARPARGWAASGSEAASAPRVAGGSSLGRAPRAASAASPTVPTVPGATQAGAAAWFERRSPRSGLALQTRAAEAQLAAEPPLDQELGLRRPLPVPQAWQLPPAHKIEPHSTLGPELRPSPLGAIPGSLPWTSWASVL